MKVLPIIATSLGNKFDKTMAGPRLVLITGINGYLAAHTAAAFLKAGFAVRGTVRARTPNVESLICTLAKYHDGSRLELVEVPDVSIDGAFDRAVQGCYYFPSPPSPRQAVSH